MKSSLLTYSLLLSSVTLSLVTSGEALAQSDEEFSAGEFSAGDPSAVAEQPPPLPEIITHLLDEMTVKSPIEGFFWLPLTDPYGVPGREGDRLEEAGLTITVTPTSDPDADPISGDVYLIDFPVDSQRYIYWRADQVMSAGEYTVHVVCESFFIQYADFTFTLSVQDTSGAMGEAKAQVMFVDGELARRGDPRYTRCCDGCPNLAECLQTCTHPVTDARMTLSMEATAREGYEGYTFAFVTDRYVRRFVDTLPSDAPVSFDAYSASEEEICFTAVAIDYTTGERVDSDPLCIDPNTLSASPLIDPSQFVIDNQQRICEGGSEGGSEGERDQTIEESGCAASSSRYLPSLSLFGLLLFALLISARREEQR